MSLLHIVSIRYTKLGQLYWHYLYTSFVHIQRAPPPTVSNQCFRCMAELKEALQLAPEGSGRAHEFDFSPQPNPCTYSVAIITAPSRYVQTTDFSAPRARCLLSIHPDEIDKA